MRYLLNKPRANIDACALCCLSGPNLTPDDAGRAQLARGESRAGKRAGNQKNLRNRKRYGEVHRH